MCNHFVWSQILYRNSPKTGQIRVMCHFYSPLSPLPPPPQLPHTDNVISKNYFIALRDQDKEMYWTIVAMRQTRTAQQQQSLLCCLLLKKCSCVDRQRGILCSLKKKKKECQGELKNWLLDGGGGGELKNCQHCWRTYKQACAFVAETSVTDM